MTSRLNARNPLCIPNEAHKCEHAVISTKGAEGVGVGAQQLSLVLTGGACISMANPPAMPSRVAHFVLISVRSRPCFVSPPVLFRFLSLSLSVSLSQSVACLCPCETHWAMAISISGQRWTEGVDSTWKIKPKKKKPHSHRTSKAVYIFTLQCLFYQWQLGDSSDAAVDRILHQFQI